MFLVFNGCYIVVLSFMEEASRYARLKPLTYQKTPPSNTPQHGQESNSCRRFRKCRKS
jgi:hypothetical protein